MPIVVRNQVFKRDERGIGMNKEKMEIKTKIKRGAKPKAEAGKETTKKDNGEHSLLSNYWYLYKGWFQHSRWNLFFVLLYLTGAVAARYVGLYLPKVAVALVMEQVSLRCCCLWDCSIFLWRRQKISASR